MTLKLMPDGKAIRCKLEVVGAAPETETSNGGGLLRNSMRIDRQILPGRWRKRREVATVRLEGGNFRGWALHWKEIKSMSSRIQYSKVAPGANRAMLGLEEYLHNCGLEASLLELIKMRASQLNGCAYCLDMHSKDARAAGETEQRLYLLDAWREAPFYSQRERAALSWAEALTLVSDNHVPDDVYTEARVHFSEKELVDLSLAVIAINGWNRLAIAFHSEVGAYQAGMASNTIKKA